PEREYPGILAAVVTQPTQAAIPRVLPGSSEGLSVEWFGQAMPLSPEHVEWQAIDAVAAACEKIEQDSIAGPYDLSDTAHVEGGKTAHSAARIIRQRRSAVAMDGQSSLESAALYRMLERTMPRRGS